MIQGRMGTRDGTEDGKGGSGEVRIGPRLLRQESLTRGLIALSGILFCDLNLKEFLRSRSEIRFEG